MLLVSKRQFFRGIPSSIQPLVTLLYIYHTNTNDIRITANLTCCLLWRS